LRDRETIVPDRRRDHRQGLRVMRCLDHRRYPTARKVSDEEFAKVNLTRHKFHGEWNYTFRPAAAKKL